MPDTVEVGSDDYFDPKATDPQWPNILGLNMRVHHWWQGDDAWDTYETLGPGPNSVSMGSGSRSQGQQGEARGSDGITHDNSIGVPTLDPNNTTPPPDPALNSAMYVDGLLLTPCIDDNGLPNGLFGIQGEAIQIWLSGVYNYQVEGLDQGQMVFPVPPEELSADFPTDNDFDADVIGLGEITIPGTEKLESIGWSSFFPRDYDASYVTIPFGWMPTPQDAIVALIWTKRYRIPCTLSIGGTPWSEQVIIKSLKWTVKAGEPGDIYYDIQFKRYRTTVISTVVIPKPPVSSDTLTNPLGDRGGLPATTSPRGSDGTQVNEVPVVPGAGEPGSALDLPVVAPLVPPIAPRESSITTGQWPVGNAGAFIFGTDSLSDVYEQIKLTSSGDLNSLSGLRVLNKDQPVSTPVLRSYASPSTPAPGTPTPSDTLTNPMRGDTYKTKISDFGDNEPLPPGTMVLYAQIIKIVSTAPTPIGTPAQRAAAVTPVIPRVKPATATTFVIDPTQAR
jgi:hypothetical protein